MNDMTADEVKTAIKAALDAGITGFTLTGLIANYCSSSHVPILKTSLNCK